MKKEQKPKKPTYNGWENRTAARIGKITKGNAATVLLVGRLVSAWIEKSKGKGKYPKGIVTCIKKIVTHPTCGHLTGQWVRKCHNAHLLILQYGKPDGKGWPGLNSFKLPAGHLVQLSRVLKARIDDPKAVLKLLAGEIKEKNLNADQTREMVSQGLVNKGQQQPLRAFDRGLNALGIATKSVTAMTEQSAKRELDTSEAVVASSGLLDLTTSLSGCVKTLSVKMAARCNCSQLADNYDRLAKALVEAAKEMRKQPITPLPETKEVTQIAKATVTGKPAANGKPAAQVEVQP